MKKIYTLTLLLLLSTGGVRAQIVDSWCGVRAGVNFSNIIARDYSSDCLTGFNVGGVYAIPASRYIPIYIEGGLYFQMTGARDNGFLTESNADSRLEIHSLVIPVVVGYTLTLNRDWNLRPFGGLYYSLALSGDVEIGDVSFEPFKASSLQRLNDSSPQDIQLLHRSDFGMRFGILTCYREMVFGLAYDIGLLNIYSPEFRDSGFEAALASFSINIGYNF